MSYWTLEGIIPACAGSTTTDSMCLRTNRDHPRMRGEHLFMIALMVVLLGSSPHARGAQRISTGATCTPRIIPACAGSTMPLSTQA